MSVRNPLSFILAILSRKQKLLPPLAPIILPIVLPLVLPIVLPLLSPISHTHCADVIAVVAPLDPHVEQWASIVAEEDVYDPEWHDLGGQG